MVIVPSSRPRVHGRAAFERALPALRELARNVPPRRALVEVNLVGKRRMAALNRRYRGRRGAAEILTFSYDDDFSSEESCRGEIYLCWVKLSQGAARRRVSRRVYLLRLVAHGLCHLRGLGHGDERSERRMEEVERKLLRAHLTDRDIDRLFA